jgi:uncharacterized protein
MYSIMSFVCGLIFGLGLTISNMINPNKVLNFLDFFGAWDPTLLVVMASALVVTSLGYVLLRRRKKPLLDDAFHMPTASAITKPLIIGSGLFGIGWGLAGYCPGPGVAALATLNTDPVFFILGLVIGSCVYHLLSKGR